MAFTQTDLDKIDRAIADGSLTVRVAGRLITRRSADELLKLRAVIATELARQAVPTRTYPRFQVATFADE